MDIYRKFEACVAKIFEEAGYDVKREVELKMGMHTKREVDMVALSHSEKLCIEIKYTLRDDRAFARVLSYSKELSMEAVVVTSEYLDGYKRKQLSTSYPDVRIVDISNLLFVVKENQELRNELLACINYSVAFIQPHKYLIESKVLKHSDYTESLIKEMEACKTGKKMARKYEILCRKMMENAFSEDLTLWNEQKKSNKGLYRFDLLCRIRNGNNKTFWSMVERFFNSKYIVFEFKNYEEPVTQKEIYTTEKYLYGKALRSVGIMIAQNGYEENAFWAAKGCFRENGKLIILLSTNDLIEINKLKAKGEEPSDYLLMILDDMLLTLEK